MPQLIELSAHGSEEGRLTVFEKILPGDIRRVFYIYGVTPEQERAKHGHKKAWNALVSVAGSCRIRVTHNQQEDTYILDSPTKCLVLSPGDWHVMDQFSEGAVLLVMSNEYYDKNDYFLDKP
ncbi:MAG: FdtA/QdtA family cupin domain-containing protein [Spirosomataceae bacterium]